MFASGMFATQAGRVELHKLAQLARSLAADESFKLDQVGAYLANPGLSDRVNQKEETNLHYSTSGGLLDADSRKPNC